MADVVFHTGFTNQFQISCDLRPFAFGADAPVAVFFRVFAVVDIASPEQFVDFAVGYDHFAQFLRPDHGGAHHVIALDTPAVVGEADDIGGHALQIGQFLTLFSNGNGAVGIYMDAGSFFDQF